MKVKFISEEFTRKYFIDITYTNNTERYTNIFSIDKEYTVYDILADDDGSTSLCIINDAGFLTYVIAYHVRVTEEDGVKFSPSQKVKVSSTKVR